MHVTAKNNKRRTTMTILVQTRAAAESTQSANSSISRAVPASKAP
jgi:hypothetical protein